MSTRLPENIVLIMPALNEELGITAVLKGLPLSLFAEIYPGRTLVDGFTRQAPLRATLDCSSQSAGVGQLEIGRAHV